MNFTPPRRRTAPPRLQYDHAGRLQRGPKTVPGRHTRHAARRRRVPRQGRVQPELPRAAGAAKGAGPPGQARYRLPDGPPARGAGPLRAPRPRAPGIIRRNAEAVPRRPEPGRPPLPPDPGGVPAGPPPRLLDRPPRRRPLPRRRPRPRRPGRTPTAG